MSVLLRLAAVSAALTLATASPVSAAPLDFPVRVQDGFTHPDPPRVDAASWILYDETAGIVLESMASDEARPMASITKIMTALLTLELADLDDTVTVSMEAATTGGQAIGLVAGERLTVNALFKALMVRSANDAATALAEHIAGSVEAFVVMMNQRASELGMERTHFLNPHGLDADGHYSSAADMLRLAQEAMTHEEFRDVVRSRVLVFPDTPDGRSRVGINTNLLLGSYHGVLGVKTGLTPRALSTMVSSAERHGRTLYAVVLGSPANSGHFADVSTLFDYGFYRLGIYGALTSGAEYLSALPGSVAEAASIEALLHLTGQGLAGGLTGVEGDTVPAPVINRRPETPPSTPLDALTFWWRQLTGTR